MNVSMTAQQVKEARRRVRAGEAVKLVAADMKLPYGIVHNAIVGRTWASIVDPPPIPVGTLVARRRRQPRVCGNCGLEYCSGEGGTSTRCGACYAHLIRHGTERKPEFLYQPRHTRIPQKQLRQLYQRYKAGQSIESLAESLPFSAETLRRRFVAAGFERRPTSRRTLTAPKVRQARELVHRDGMMIQSLAEQWQINYSTLYSAVMGQTWRAAGGPLPETEDEKKPCRSCELLTAHPSGLCRYCR